MSASEAHCEILKRDSTDCKIKIHSLAFRRRREFGKAGLGSLFATLSSLSTDSAERKFV